MPQIGRCPELGLAGAFRLMGENGCDGANELVIPCSAWPCCLYWTGALVLSGVGLEIFVLRLNISVILFDFTSQLFQCVIRACVRYFIFHVNPRESQ